MTGRPFTFPTPKCCFGGGDTQNVTMLSRISTVTRCCFAKIWGFSALLNEPFQFPDLFLQRLDGSSGGVLHFAHLVFFHH